MSLDKQALFWLAATVGGYLLSRQLYRRVKWYWLSPIVFVLRESEINQKGKARKLWDIEEGKGI